MIVRNLNAGIAALAAGLLILSGCSGAESDALAPVAAAEAAATRAEAAATRAEKAARSAGANQQTVVMEEEPELALEGDTGDEGGVVSDSGTIFPAPAPAPPPQVVN